MDTKWKSIASRSSDIVKRNRRIIAGWVSLTAALVLFLILFREAPGTPTRIVLLAGIIINILVLYGIHNILKEGLEKRYGAWQPSPLSQSPYDEWNEEWMRQQKMIIIVFSALMLGAIMFFLNIMFGRSRFYYNYAFGYFLIISVGVQWAGAEVTVVGYLKEKLSQFVSLAAEINRKKLADAVEMERQSMEKAAKSEQLKVDLISNVSHDLKTPLTSMVGYIELLKKEELSPVCQDYVDVISSRAEKLKEMIESLFSLAKASSGNIELHKEIIDMNRLIEQIFADMEDKTDASGLTFVKQLTGEDTRLVTDNALMYRICQNLIENALKYSAKGTRVFVKTFVQPEEKSLLEGRKICLEITNTAGYMMDFEKEDIIERFARGDKSRSSEGNGLGLAIVSTYTGALGGLFDIFIDCDQFRVRLAFPDGIDEIAN